MGTARRRRADTPMKYKSGVRVWARSSREIRREQERRLRRERRAAPRAALTKLRLCPTGKYSYASEAEARKMLAFWGSRPDRLSHKGRAPRSVYRCPHCRYWHLTTRRQ
jgi:hypothetical protein